ncbi:NADP-dependent glyceraldehyde-3-phosphate dehydrogenase [Nanoarchaeota archaeon]
MNEKIFPKEEEIPKEYRINPIEQKKYLVNGELREWDGETQSVLSPVCIESYALSNDSSSIAKKYLGSYPMLTEKESLEALDAAVNAYDHGRGEWPTMPVEKRIEHVENFIYNMGKVRDEVVNLLMWEIGKSYKDSAKEFDRTIDYIKDTIDALKDLDNGSSRFSSEDGVLAQIRRSSLGTVLCMGPFNYPLNETYTTLIPALIMGNTVVFKPAKYGVLLHEPLLKAYQESFPKGVINTVYGDGAEVIGPIMESGKVDVLAFIGSAFVANLLKKQHPKLNRLKSVLGLNAKNPAIILPDADMENTVNECVQGSLSYNGQRCTALKLIYVHKDVADEFNSKFIEKVDNLKLGMPWTPNVNITPLPEAGKIEYLLDLVMDAQANGAKIVNNGGLREDGKFKVSDHTFFSPVVIYPVNDKMKIFQQEQFGPIVPIIPFDDINEPLNYVVNSEFGQQLSIFGKDIDTISKLIDPLTNQVSRININCQCQRGPDQYPFTGRKDSAEGTLSVTDALKVFSIRTMVAAKLTDENKEILKDIVKENKSKFLSTDYIF